MRILHVVVGLDPALGGPPAVAARLAAAQAMHGHHVALAAHESPQRESQVQQSLKGIPGIDRVAMVMVDPSVRAGWLIANSARERLRSAVNDADVVHLHGLWEPLIRTAAGVAHAVGKRYVLTPHGMLDPYSLRQRWLKKKLAMALVYRRMIDRAACLHLLNDDELRLLAALRLGVDTVVIPNGVFLQEIDPLPPRGSFRSSPAGAGLGERPFVLFLGRLHYKKGLDYLADAFAIVARAMPEARLVVAGPDEGARDPFLTQIDRLGIADRVILTGPIYGATKLGAMVDAAAFCLPSRQEGFSVAITEALACGAPAVISEDCHFPEVAAVGAGFVLPLNAEQFGQSLVQLLAEPEKAREMGQVGRSLVLERFTWPAIADRMIEVYERSAGTR